MKSTKAKTGPTSTGPGTHTPISWVTIIGMLLFVLPIILLFMLQYSSSEEAQYDFLLVTFYALPAAIIGLVLIHAGHSTTAVTYKSQTNFNINQVVKIIGWIVTASLTAYVIWWFSAQESFYSTRG